MIEKAILLLWIGFGNSEVLDVERYDSMVECRAVAEALRKHHHRLDGECIPYRFDEKRSARICMGDDCKDIIGPGQ